MFIINALNARTYRGQTIFLIACCCFDYTCLIVNILTEAEFESRKKQNIFKTSASIFLSAGAIIRPRLIRREFIRRNAFCFCLSSAGNARKRSYCVRLLLRHISPQITLFPRLFICATLPLLWRLFPNAVQLN